MCELIVERWSVRCDVSTGVSGSKDPAFAGLQLLNTKEKILVNTLAYAGCEDPFMHGPYIRKSKNFRGT